jgi:hypothetical protein
MPFDAIRHAHQMLNNFFVMIKQAGFFIQRFDGNFFIAWQ